LIVVTGYWSLAIRNVHRMTLADFKITAKRWKLQVAIAVGLAVFGWFWFGFYSLVTRGQWLDTGFGGSFSVVLAIIAVGSAEEIFFRGYLQNRLSPNYSLWLRVLITVVAMAFYKNVVHMWEGMTPTLHMELLLIGILHNILPSLWMEWSDSLVGPWVLHVVWDLLVYAPMAAIPYWVI
jgi:membrane protease YdiL (CAAX protease family)